MKLIVGLGNPGDQYEDTRHNMGFMVVDHVIKELSTTSVLWQEDKRANAVITKVGEDIFVKPKTFMNNSGMAVQKLLGYYKSDASDLWVIHDDLDLPLGKIRIRFGGSAGGHNGVESIIEQVGTDAFLRFRLGIGRGKETDPEHPDRVMQHRTVIKYVLSKFTDHEAGEMRKLIHHATDAVQMAITEGIDRAMNRYN